MNQRLRCKDCDAKIVTQRLLRKGEDFYGVNLSKNLTTYLVKHLSKNLVPHLSKNLVSHLSKNLTKYLMKYLPNPGLRKAFLMIDLEDWCIPRSTFRLSSRSKGCVWFDLERIPSK